MSHFIFFRIADAIRKVFSGQYTERIEGASQPGFPQLQVAFLSCPQACKFTALILRMIDPFLFDGMKTHIHDPGIRILQRFHIHAHWLVGYGADSQHPAMGQVEMDIRIIGQHRFSIAEAAET